MTDVQVHVTEYAVSVLPLDDPDSLVWGMTVEYRGDGLWAVCRHKRCLGVDGTWDWESIPSDREEEWLAEHRFDLDTALRLAREAAPGLRMNGRTALQVAAEKGST